MTLQVVECSMFVTSASTSPKVGTKYSQHVNTSKHVPSLSNGPTLSRTNRTAKSNALEVTADRLASAAALS